MQNCSLTSNEFHLLELIHNSVQPMNVKDAKRELGTIRAVNSLQRKGILSLGENGELILCKEHGLWFMGKKEQNERNIISHWQKHNETELSGSFYFSKLGTIIYFSYRLVDRDIALYFPHFDCPYMSQSPELLKFVTDFQDAFFLEKSHKNYGTHIGVTNMYHHVLSGHLFTSKLKTSAQTLINYVNAFLL